MVVCSNPLRRNRSSATSRMRAEVASAFLVNVVVGSILNMFNNRNSARTEECQDIFEPVQYRATGGPTWPASSATQLDSQPYLALYPRKQTVTPRHPKCTGPIPSNCLRV